MLPKDIPTLPKNIAGFLSVSRNGEVIAEKMPREESDLTLDRQLLSRIADKDEEAFAVIYKHYARKIYTFSFRLLKSKQLAEEIVQEVFLKIWLMGDALNAVHHTEAYLVTLARNKSLDVLRQQQRALKSGIQDGKNWIEGHNETEEAILLNDTRNLLQAAIDQLPPQQKLVYQLCQQEGLKYEEAAEKLNLSPLTIKTHMQHALRFVRLHVAKNSKITIALILLKIL